MNSNFAKDAREFLRKNGENDCETSRHCVTEKMQKLYKKYGETRDSACSWVVPETSDIVVKTTPMLDDSFVDNTREVLLLVKDVSCKCGLYKNVDLAWGGRVDELMKAVYADKDSHFTL